MASAFEELDYQETPQGALILRRRKALSLGGVDVYEVTLGGEFLMSSLVDDSERALATLPLSALGERPADVLIGGLGLGATLQAALALDHVRSVTVVEISPAVIGWHRRGLVPMGADLTGNPRCRIVEADFFSLLAADPEEDSPLSSAGDAAVLADIDHSPASLLHAGHAPFYGTEGLGQARRWLTPGGVLAVWSADPPETAFLEDLRAVFATAEARVVKFRNPLLDLEDENTIYLGWR